MSRIYWLTLFVAISTLASCASFHAESPQGFAPYREGKDFRAVSPDGVLYKVSAEKHKPKADLAFWKEALALRMRAAGYHITDSLSLTIDNTPAFGLLLEAPLGTSDQSYLIVAIPGNSHIVVVEAAGDTPKFAARKDDILTAVRNIDLK